MVDAMELTDMLFTSFNRDTFSKKIVTLLQKYKATTFASMRVIFLGMLYTMVNSSVGDRQSIMETFISSHNPNRILMGVVRNVDGHTRFEMFCFMERLPPSQDSNSKQIFIDQKSFLELKQLWDKSGYNYNLHDDYIMEVQTLELSANLGSVKSNQRKLLVGELACGESFHSMKHWRDYYQFNKINPDHPPTTGEPVGMDFYEKTLKHWSTICKKLNLPNEDNTVLYRFLIGGLQNWQNNLNIKIYAKWDQEIVDRETFRSTQELLYLGIAIEVFKGRVMNHYGTPMYLMIETDPVPEIQVEKFIEKIRKSMNHLWIKSESNTYQSIVCVKVKEKGTFLKIAEPRSIFGRGQFHRKALSVRLFDTPTVDEKLIYLMHLISKICRVAESIDSLALYIFGKLTRQLFGDKNFILRPQENRLRFFGLGIGDHVFLATNSQKSEAIVISISDSNVDYKKLRDTINNVLKDVQGKIECRQVVSIGKIFSTLY